MLLLGAKSDRWFVVSAGRPRARKEVDVDAADPPRAELYIAGTRPPMGFCQFIASQARDEGRGNGSSRALCEQPRFRRPLLCAIAERVDAGETRLKRMGVHRHITILSHAARLNHVRSAVLWHAKEQVVRNLSSILECGDVPAGVK